MMRISFDDLDPVPDRWFFGMTVFAKGRLEIQVDRVNFEDRVVEFDSYIPTANRRTVGAG